MNVFLSVGRTSTSQQEEFVRAIEAHLRANGLEPKTVGRTSFSSNQPLRHVQALMVSVCIQDPSVTEIESMGKAMPVQIFPIAR